MTISRVVTLLTPIFAGIAGWIATWIAENFPGTPQLDSGELTAIFVAGALTAAAAAQKWIENRGKWEIAHPEKA